MRPRGRAEREHGVEGCLPIAERPPSRPVFGIERVVAAASCLQPFAPRPIVSSSSPRPLCRARRRSGALLRRLLVSYLVVFTALYFGEPGPVKKADIERTIADAGSRVGGLRAERDDGDALEDEGGREPETRVKREAAMHELTIRDAVDSRQGASSPHHGRECAAGNLGDPQSGRRRSGRPTID